jgi:NAD/NADP transhydrogenase alpha subunit
MLTGVPLETAAGETRVAVTPALHTPLMSVTNVKRKEKKAPVAALEAAK